MGPSASASASEKRTRPPHLVNPVVSELVLEMTLGAFQTWNHRYISKDISICMVFLHIIIHKLYLY